MMMKKMAADVDIVVDTSTLRLTAAGSVTGVVHFRFGETAFPEEKWRDFVVRLLTWWLKSLARMRLRIHKYHEFRFMEADFVVDGFWDGVGNPMLSGRSFREWPGTNDRFAVEPGQLAQSLLSASEEVLGAVEAHGWRSPEIDEFARILRRVKELVPQ